LPPFCFQLYHFYLRGINKREENNLRRDRVVVYTNMTSMPLFVKENGRYDNSKNRR
jgi:hypothetical protein